VDFKRIINLIDAHGFDWNIWAVAGAGVFGASYTLSITSFIIPSVAFVYWPTETSSANATLTKSLTLSGIVVGALCFGYIADQYGRRRVYGYGLSIILISILGLAQVSAGFNNATMSFLGWISFWQFVLGTGIGATFTSAAVLTTE